MKIKELIKELKNYDDNLECDFMLVQDCNESLDSKYDFENEFRIAKEYYNDEKLEEETA